MLRPILAAFCGGTLLMVTAATATLLPSFHRAPAKAPAPASSAAEPIERLDLLETLRSAHRPRVGAVADDFDVKDEIGARFHLRSLLDRPLLLSAFCTCAHCKATARLWSDLQRKFPNRFNAGAVVALPRGEQLFDFHDELRVTFPLIPDADHTLSAHYPGPGEGYAGLACPRAWVIGRDGRYRYVMPAGKVPGAKELREIAHALELPTQSTEK